MLGRLFGRAKDNHDDTMCSSCGRTLLAGEWTQRLVGDDGSERFICSLCSPSEGSPGSSPLEPADEMAAVTSGRVKPLRTDSDAFWRALKDKDAEIERLESRLARAEAEKQELAAQLAQSRSDSESRRPPEASAETAEFDAPALAADGGFAATQLQGDEATRFPADEATRFPADEATQFPGDETAQIRTADTAQAEDGADVAAATVSAAALDHTDPRLGEALRRAAEADASTGPSAASDKAAFEAADDVVPDDVAAFAAPSGAAGGASAPAVSPFDGASDDTLIGEAPVDETAAGEPAADELEPDELIPLTILQRGVDLLNVSAVPKRIVETNENLGMPQVHVGSQGESTLLVTFMWSMGWYQFRVELAESGRISLADRGYEERVDLRPNASVRADGTVQLAPSRIKPPTPKDASEAKPSGVTSGVIISKSMMGQRTDDENVPADWKSQRAPDFDWGR
jgi:hypothetical protein